MCIECPLFTRLSGDRQQCLSCPVGMYATPLGDCKQCKVGFKTTDGRTCYKAKIECLERQKYVAATNECIDCKLYERLSKDGTQCLGCPKT